MHTETLYKKDTNGVFRVPVGITVESHQGVFDIEQNGKIQEVKGE